VYDAGMKKALLLFALLLSMFCESSCSHREDYKRPLVRPITTIEDFKLALLAFNTKKEDMVYNFELETIFKKNIFISDTTYWTPSEDWIEKEVIDHYKAHVEYMEIKYDKRFDCDDFARTFATFAHMRYYRNKKDEMCQSIAVGEVWYKPDPLNNPLNVFNHAINVIILDDKNVMFLEPQGCVRVMLTEYEFNNIILVKF
jgi:hypothetical protein